MWRCSRGLCTRFGLPSSSGGRLRVSSADVGEDLATGSARPRCPRQPAGSLAHRGAVLGGQLRSPGRTSTEQRPRRPATRRVARSPTGPRRPRLERGHRLAGRRRVGVAGRLQPEQRRAGLDLAAGDRPTPRLTRPANGACSTVSIFIASSTTTVAPASTSSPRLPGCDHHAGAGERMTPPSSRATRWPTPSTSTRWSPWVAATRRYACRPRQAPDGSRSMRSTSDVELGHLGGARPGSARGRSGPSDLVVGRAHLQLDGPTAWCGPAAGRRARSDEAGGLGPHPASS